MSVSVRRLSDDRVEVRFGKALPIESSQGSSLLEFSETNPVELIRTEEGLIEGVRCEPRDYVAFLQSRGLSNAVINGFRRALDDSRKAVRRRQRG